MSMKIDGNELIALGFPKSKAIRLALKIANSLLDDGYSREQVMGQMKALLVDSAEFVDHDTWQPVAKVLEAARAARPQLRAEPVTPAVWGRELIGDNAYEQIMAVAQLPVTMAVALMPDAHLGYGLPIGGVAALEGVIAPYMVGVDIGCRMHATIYERNPIHLQQQGKQYRQMLLDNTWFGRGVPTQNNRAQHAILDDPRWAMLPNAVGNNSDLAARQLGSSGGGNHFVEWVKLTVSAENPFGLDEGKYIALVSHSGSRGPGYKIAKHYSRMAERICNFLPKGYTKLAWLDYKTGEGQEYEMAMSLAGDFARANHEVIHARMAAAMGVSPIATLQNHHNFAWRVDRDGDLPVFIHRKGATPASKGVVGIIPGSMATPGFFVEGQCNEADAILEHPSLNSAAHGSGRVLGRKRAIETLDANSVRKQLAKRGVTLLGGGLDEAPGAYKASRKVIAAQSDLVRVWAEFEPAIVRMAGDSGKTLGEKTGDLTWERRKKRKGKRRR